MEFAMRKLVLIAVLILAACTSNVTPTIAPVITSSAVPTTAPNVTAPIVSTSQPAPTQPPTNGVDLSPYRVAMRPEFAKDVDRFANATQYQIDLTIAPDLASYSATQKVRYTNTETTTLDSVYFRLFPNAPSYGGHLTVSSVQLNGADIKPILEVGDSALKVALAQPLKPGEVAEFDLAYAATVPTQTLASGYDQFGLFNHILTLPDFYPLIPAYDDQGWHIEDAPGYGDAVFSDSALYQVDILAPKDQVIATSGVCESQAAPAGQQYQHCVSGPMRDFMIGMSRDYVIASDTVDGVTVNSYFTQTEKLAGQRGLQIVVDAIMSYQRRIGPYPFSELDLLETPTAAGGIEYPGLIVIAQGIYERNPGFFEGATAHEAAHQWWYSLVGDDQVNDPWLDEAFVQFTTALYYLDVYGKDGFDSYAQQALLDRYNRVKGTNEDKRADLPVAAYSELQYGAIVYGKAPLFFNALYQKMGDDQFDQFMQTYFNTYRYGVAYPQDLYSIAAQFVDPGTLDELEKEWITTP
jgi:aminopeptidase N